MQTPPLDTNHATPTTRVHLYPDDDATNPLTDWDHGVELFTLPEPSRAARDYTEIEYMSSPYAAPLDPEGYGWDQYREWYDEYDSDAPAHMLPSFITWLNTHCAAWGTVDRSGYDGTLRLYPYDADEIERAPGIACISRASFRHCMMLPDNAPMTKHRKRHAVDLLQGVIDEYNKWATGDVYGYVVEEHNPACPYCEDATNPDQDCKCWDTTDDACWGFIGYEYAIDTMNEITDHYRQEGGRDA